MPYYMLKTNSNGKLCMLSPSDWDLLPGEDGLCIDPAIEATLVRSGPLLAPSIGIVAMVLYLISSGTCEFAFL